MRPIISTISSPTYLFAKELARILSPLTGKTTHTVRNSAHFIQTVKDIKLVDCEKMVSFNVTSLFTKVPTQEAIKITR